MYTKKTIDFLMENRAQNSKEWYHDHKAEYQELVLEPTIELVEYLAPAMLEIDPQFITTAKVDRCISRLHRDTRFSKDKSMFRDVVWIVFMRDKKLFNGPPGFFFEFSPRMMRWGCGSYQSSPAAMQAYRELILASDPAFTKARAAAEKRPDIPLYSEAYKRSKHPEQPAEIRAWLDRKSMGMIKEHHDLSLLFSPDLGKHLRKDFCDLAPAYHFFIKAEDCARDTARAEEQRKWDAWD